MFCTSAPPNETSSFFFGLRVCMFHGFINVALCANHKMYCHTMYYVFESVCLSCWMHVYAQSNTNSQKTGNLCCSQISLLLLFGAASACRFGSAAFYSRTFPTLLRSLLRESNSLVPKFILSSITLVQLRISS